MKNLTPIKLLWLLVLWAGVGSFACAQDVEDDEKDEDDIRNEMLQDGIREAVHDVLLLEYMLAAEEQAAFFQLDESSSKKLSILAKGLVNEKLKKFTDERITQSASQLMQNIVPGVTFAINGKEFTLPDQKAEKPFARIIIAIVNHYVWMETKTNNQSMGTSLLSVGRLNTVDDRKWKTLLTSNSEVSIESYKEFQTQRLKECISDFMTSQVAESLAVSPSQRDALNLWMLERVKVNTGATVYQNAKTSLGALEDRPDKILNETQMNAWRLMISKQIQ